MKSELCVTRILRRRFGGEAPTFQSPPKATSRSDKERSTISILETEYLSSMAGVDGIPSIDSKFELFAQGLITLYS